MTCVPGLRLDGDGHADLLGDRRPDVGLDAGRLDGVVYGKSNALLLHQIRSGALVPPKEAS
jgi:hypothetical protein